MKKVKRYLPFEVDFISNDLHSELIERYGAHGLGIYFMVLMELRKHEGYRCGLSTIKGAARRCVADFEMLESILCDFGLFEFHECGNRVLISSVYIDRVMQPFDEKTRRFSSTADENTVTVKRPVHGVSTVTYRIILNKIEIKTKIKTTTTINTKAANAANVVDVDVAADVNELDLKAGIPQLGKLWEEYREKSIAGEQRMQPLANLMRKGVTTLLQQHDKRVEWHLPCLVETADPGARERSCFGNGMPRGSPPPPYDDAMRCPNQAKA